MSTKEATVTKRYGVGFLLGTVVLTSAWAAGAPENLATLEGVRRLEVDAGVLPLEVIGDETGVTTIDADGVNPSCRVEWALREDTLIIVVPTETTNNRTCAGGRLLITVPNDATISARSTTGSIRVRDIATPDGSVVLDSRTGSIRVSDISASITISASTGNVEATDCTGTMVLRADAGDISVRDGAGSLDVAGGSGEAVVDRFDGAVTAVVSTGRVYVRAATGAIDLATTTADVEVREPAGTEAVRIVTDTGSVYARLGDSFRRYQFTIRADTGALRVGSVRASGEIVAGDGAVPFVVRSATGEVSIR